MPLYEYQCLDCNDRFDRLVPASRSTDVTCERCDGANVRRLVSAFAMVGGTNESFASSPTTGGGCCGGGCGCGSRN